MIFRRTSVLSDDRGFALGLVLFTIVLLSSLALSLSTTTLATRRQHAYDLDVDRAAFIARAGFERSCAEILLGSDDWSTLDAAAFQDESFSDGLYTVIFEGLSVDAATIVVNATYMDTQRTLEFSAQRESSQQSGGGSSATTGVTIVGLSDPTLDILVH